MNTNLYGKTILIGREQDQGRLYVCVMVDGQPYSFPIGNPQSVPNTVSRCQPKEGKAHCSIEVDGKGRMLLTNLKTQNVTYVDGNEVLKKYIDKFNRVTLGCNQYTMDLTTIIDTATKIVTKVEKLAPKSYSISHLENVWNSYNIRNEEIDKEQVVTNLLFRIPFIFSAIGGVVTGIAKANGMESLGNISLVLTIIGVIALLYGSYKSIKSPAAKAKKENLTDFKNKYVCPNPDCRRKLTNFDFEELQKIKKCPYCGCIFK